MVTGAGKRRSNAVNMDEDMDIMDKTEKALESQTTTISEYEEILDQPFESTIEDAITATLLDKVRNGTYRPHTDVEVLSILSKLKITPPLMHELTSHLAHIIWLSEGRPDGRAVAHWLAAEALLKGVFEVDRMLPPTIAPSTVIPTALSMALSSRLLMNNIEQSTPFCQHRKQCKSVK